MNTENKVPTIRFKAFNNEWNKQELGKLVNLENGFAFKSKYFQIEPTNVIVLTPGSVSVGGGFQSGKGQFYDVNQIVPDKYVFKPRDLFITMTDLTPAAQALGFPAIIPDDGNTYLHNQRLGKLVGFKGDLDFLFYLFCTPKKQKEIVLTSSGTTVKHTSPSKFLNRYSYLPEKNEQTKIGNYFQQIDKLITLHQKKHDKLLNLKKSLLEKMYPKQDRKEPEIRFKGFSGEWEEKTLGENSDLLTGNPFDSKKFSKDGIFLVRGINVKRGYLDISEDISEYWPTSHDLERFLLKDDDVVIQMDGALIGKSYAKIQSKHLPALLVQRVTRIRSSNIDSEFTYQSIQRDFLKYISRIKTETAVPHLSLNDIRSFFISTPKEKEQKKIGNFFKQLDTLLNHHQAQLKKLNNIKQACLEKMFV